jgi:cyclophilin family peptidyl-prolyl cis-trans isomerase
VRIAAALAAVVLVATACGSTAAAPTATPIRTAPPVIRTATAAPSILCPAAPDQPSTKATITLDTGGTIVIQLRPDKAPKTVSNFAFRANKGLYDGLTFHRVVPNFVIQGGDPKGDGTGGSTQCTELSDLSFVKGAVGIARANDIAISNDFQFFICIGACTFLDRMYTNFGQVISGQDVADAVKIGDKIKSIRVE